MTGEAALPGHVRYMAAGHVCPHVMTLTCQPVDQGHALLQRAVRHVLQVQQHCS